MKLLLFDIDGTILRARGMGRAAVQRSLGTLIGQEVTIDGISFGGRTDPQIIRDVMTRNGCSADDDLIRKALAVFERTAAAHFDPNRVMLIEGVAQLVHHLHERDDVQLGLLTGNVERMARLKLDAVELDTYFPFGAFGSDHEDRHQLPAIAVERAFRHGGRRFAGRDVVIIGDTCHDILCGRSLGVYAVAVATGYSDRDELARYGPDLLLDDLTDLNRFVAEVVER